MDARHEMLKYIRPGKGMRVATLIFAIIMAVGAVFVVYSYMGGEQAQPVPFDVGASESGDYASVSILGVSEWIYKQDNNVWYIAEDESFAPFVVRLTTSAYNKMSDLQAYFYRTSAFERKPAAVTLTGVVKVSPNDLREHVNDIINETWAGMGYTGIGRVYLDATTGIGTHRATPFIVLTGIGALLFCIFYFSSLTVRRCASACDGQLRRKGALDDAAAQFLAEDTLKLPGDIARLGADFVYGKRTGAVVAYEDILWYYKKVVSRNFMVTNEALCVCTRFRKNIPVISVAGTRNSARQQAMFDAFDIIHKKCPDALMGYSKQNAQEYKRIVNR